MGRNINKKRPQVSQARYHGGGPESGTQRSGLNNGIGQKSQNEKKIAREEKKINRDTAPGPNAGRDHYEIHCTIDWNMEQLIDHHSGGDLALHVGGELSRLFLGACLLVLDMGLETMVEVVDTHASVDDGNHNEDEGDHSEECH